MRAEAVSDQTHTLDQFNLNWAALVKAALLGTQREPIPVIPSETLLGRLLARLDPADPEAHLLGLAGALALYQQAGQRPVTTASPAAAGPPGETRPYCSPAVEQCLNTILNSRFQDLLPEFLTALAGRGQRAPAVFLPNLLERGAKTTSLRPFIVPVLGASGRWLAAQRADWCYASLELDHWDTALALWRRVDGAGRQAVLRQMRQVAPEQGRQLLESTWKNEPSSLRPLLIKQLEANLSLADEPFLEVALDDRVHLVRRKAVELLARLPDSRLCGRMAAAARGLLSWQPQQAEQIVVSFPQHLTPQLRRDGVSTPQYKELARVRTVQIIDMLGAVPLAQWTGTWLAGPEAIVRGALTSRWPATLIRGFALAAERQNNVEWAMALLTYDNYSVNTIRLVDILPPDQFQTLVAQLDAATTLLNKDSSLLKVIRRWPQPWPEPVARRWLAQMVRFIEHDNQMTPDGILRGIVRQFARACPVDLTDLVVQTLAPVIANNPVWQSPLQDVVTILKFRAVMLAEIDQS